MNGGEAHVLSSSLETVNEIPSLELVNGAGIPQPGTCEWEPYMERGLDSCGLVRIRCLQCGLNSGVVWWNMLFIPILSELQCVFQSLHEV